MEGRASMGQIFLVGRCLSHGCSQGVAGSAVAIGQRWGSWTHVFSLLSSPGVLFHLFSSTDPGVLQIVCLLRDNCGWIID